jgi:hypothetical protein
MKIEINRQKYEDLKRDCETIDAEYNNNKKQNEAFLTIENKKQELKKFVIKF